MTLSFYSWGPSTLVHLWTLYNISHLQCGLWTFFFNLNCCSAIHPMPGIHGSKKTKCITLAQSSAPISTLIAPSPLHPWLVKPPPIRGKDCWWFLFIHQMGDEKESGDEGWGGWGVCTAATVEIIWYTLNRQLLSLPHCHLNWMDWHKQVKYQ